MADSLRVTIKTKDSTANGTHANIKISFKDVHGTSTKFYSIPVSFRKDIRESLDTFVAKGLPANFGHVSYIEILRGSSNDHVERLYLEWVKVSAWEPGSTPSEFPVHRWLVKGRVIKINGYDTCLPQKDEDLPYRKEELRLKRKEYQAKVKIPGFLAQVASLPKAEEFSFNYKRHLGVKLLELKVLVEWERKTHFHRGKYDEEIARYFGKLLPRPISMDGWHTDGAFGELRLNHCNPAIIRLCKALPENLGVTERVLLPFLEGATLQESLDDKRLYFIDYKIMEDLPHTGGCEVCAPIALFFVNDERSFMPIAIQLYQDPSRADNPVFLPSDDQHTWWLAKMWFNLADASVHQSCSHLGFTHILIESVCLATHRSLSPSHPLFKLLAPHFLYVMAIDSLAVSTLINPHGWVDQAMNIGREGMFELMKRRLAEWRMDVQGTLLEDLKDRGVDDVEALPHYHYRDDALLINKAIHDYVKEVVTAFYESAEDIRDDYELQDWAYCLSASPDEENREKKGMGIPGVHGGGKFESIEEIVAVCTSIISTSSLVHASVNFSQYDDYGYPPNYSASMRGSPITDKEHRSEEEVEAFFPTMTVTTDIMTMTRILSERSTKSLGDFEVQYLFDEKSVAAVKRFRHRLAEIGDEIEQRNDSRPVPYTLLEPDHIPNAISI